MDVGPSVQETLALVYRLQTIDSELVHIIGEIEAARAHLKGKEDGLSELSLRIDAEKRELLGLSREKKDKEEELRTNEHIISENKKKNKELKHSREIQAYMAEMEFRRDEVERLQDEILRLMETIETLEGTQEKRAAEIATYREELETAKTDLLERQKEREGEIADLEREKASLMENFPETLLDQYKRLKVSHKNGLVVSRIQGETCGVCRMVLPPRTMTEVKKRQKIVPCLHCQRWLYLEGEIEKGEKRTV